MELIRHSYNFEKFKEYLDEHQQILDNDKYIEFLEAAIMYNNIDIVNFLIDRNLDTNKYIPILYDVKSKGVLDLYLQKGDDLQTSWHYGRHLIA